MSMGWGIAAQEAVQAGKEVGMSFLQDMFNARSQKRAYRYAKKLYKKRYQYTVRDMRDAGLNPVLAARGGFGGAGGVSQGAAPSVSVPSSPTSAFQSYLSAKQTAEMTRNLSQDTRLKRVQTGKEAELGVKAHADANTAMSAARIRSVEAKLAERYGTSAFGRFLGTGDRTGRYMRQRLDDAIKKLTTKAPRKGAKTWSYPLPK